MLGFMGRLGSAGWSGVGGNGGGFGGVQVRGLGSGRSKELGSKGLELESEKFGRSWRSLVGGVWVEGSGWDWAGRRDRGRGVGSGGWG